jgi:uncharacterized protein (DUF58 family)
VSARDLLEQPAGRQGPGPIAARLVETLDLSLVRRAGGPLPGEHRASQVGGGTELDRLRPYQPGDDVRHLDPAASARTGVPHVRLHVPERLMTTWVLLDISPSMAFGTADRLKADVAEGVVRVLGRLATRRGGRVALLTCGGPVKRLLPPRGGRAASVALGRVLGEGLTVDGHGDEHDLGRALGRLARIARMPGLVVVASDFRGPRDWRRPLRGLASRHSVVAVEIRDPREESLPAAGRLALVDPETGRRVEVDTGSSRLRERYERRERAEREGVRSELRRAGVEHVVLSTRGQWLDELGRRMR